MQALTVSSRTWGHSATGKGPLRLVHRIDPPLVAGVVAFALAVALLFSMLPALARVPVDGSAVPAPTPAPVPIVVESAR